MMRSYGVGSQRARIVEGIDFSSDDKTINWARPPLRFKMSLIPKKYRKDLMTIPQDGFGHIQRENIAKKFIKLKNTEPKKRRRIMRVILKFSDPEHNKRSLVWSERNIDNLVKYMKKNPRAITYLEGVDVSKFRESNPSMVMKELKRRYGKG